MSTHQDPSPSRLCLWCQGTDHEMPVDYVSVIVETFSVLIFFLIKHLTLYWEYSRWTML